MRIQTSVATLVMAAVLASCASAPVLLPRSAANPAGVDLSGEWQIRGDTEGGVRHNLRDSLVDVFVETGSRLKITQTDYGIFVSFDRSVVEEYNFGEQRQVNVGPVEASRVSGWDGTAYVVETMGRKGDKLVDRYWLEQGGAVLVRRVEIWDRSERNVSVEFIFDRV